jgi:hypothetical protein
VAVAWPPHHHELSDRPRTRLIYARSLPSLRRSSPPRSCALGVVKVVRPSTAWEKFCRTCMVGLKWP